MLDCAAPPTTTTCRAALVPGVALAIAFVTATPAVVRAEGSTCVGCVIPVACQVPSGANACACLIQAFGQVTICREKGFCDEGCGEPLPDAASRRSGQAAPALDRTKVDRASVRRSAIQQLFDREPLLAVAIAGYFDYDDSGAMFLNLEPYGGGTFEYAGVPYTHQGQFKKLGDSRVQFRFQIREARPDGNQVTFVGEILDKGTAVNYSRLRLDAAGNLIERTHYEWKAP